LRIIKKYISDKNRTTEPRTPEENISTVLAPAEIIQAIICLFLKSNRVTATNDKITTVLA